MFHDLRLAVRSLLRTPGFCAIAILTLALGIGVNTAMFSLLNGLMLRPLSFPEPERLFRLSHPRPNQQFSDFSAANFTELTSATQDVAELAAFRFWAFTLTDDTGAPDVPNAVRVTANYFDVLGLRTALGRSFTPDEQTSGRDNVIVLTHRYWQSRFAGDPDAVGRTVRLDGTPVTIIGVLPAEDDTPRVLAPLGFYRPLVLDGATALDRLDDSFGVFGRYRDGITPEQATRHYETIARRLAADHPEENVGRTLVVNPLQSTTLMGVGRLMTFLLVGLSGFVLLIACANLANLLLARALARTREFSVRTALGATRAQLVRPQVAECLLLALTGGLAATLVSVWVTAWLAQRFGTPDNPVDFSADGRVLLFTVTASLCTALLFGVAPAWWAARTGFNDALKSGARGATGSLARSRFRHLLIVTQFALSLVLLAGAGFFLRGLHRLTHGNEGWDPRPVISGTLNLASTRYNAAEPIIAFHEELRNRLLQLPGVANATVSFETPLYNSPARRGYRVEGRNPPPPGREPQAYVNAVSASFFDTMGIRLLRGRLLDHTDQLTTRQVVVINESMARALFPDDDALGQRLGLAGHDDPFWAEVVGIVADARALQVTPPSTLFQVYKPYPQESWQYVRISVRAADPALAPTMVEPIRQTVASLDSDQPVLGLMPVADQIIRNNGFWETVNQLLVLFAGLGLFLAAFGIYGVIARLVAQRTTEIGIRMALGAQIRDIVSLVLGNGARLALLGAVFGLGGSFLLGSYLTKEMPVFGGSGLLPVAGAAALLMLVALLACWLPARRATKVDPMVALRSE